MAEASSSIKFTDEGDGMCSCTPGNTAADNDVFAAFRAHCSISSANEFNDASPLLFKVTVDNKESAKKQQAKLIAFVGIPNSTPFASALELCNRMYCKTSTDATGEASQGAFLLDSGYAINPKKSAGNIFMAHGNELTFHTKVDFTRLAFAA